MGGGVGGEGGNGGGIGRGGNGGGASAKRVSKSAAKGVAGLDSDLEGALETTGVGLWEGRKEVIYCASVGMRGSSSSGTGCPGLTL